MGRKRYRAAIAVVGVIGAMTLGNAFTNYAADGWTKLDDHWAYIYSGQVHTGQFQASEGWYYMDLPTGLIAAGFKQIDGERYFFKPGGLIVTGWVSPEDGEWHYMLGDRTIVTRWLKVGDDYYSIRSNGTMGTR